MDFRNLEVGTTIKFYSSWSDQYMIGDIIEKKQNGYQVEIKSRVANSIFVEQNDIVSVIDKTIKFEPVIEEPIIEEVLEVVEEPIVEIPIVEEPIVEEPIVEEPIVEEPIVEEPIVEEPIVEEPIVEIPIVEEEKKSSFQGLFANGGITNSQNNIGLPNELTIYIPFYDVDGNPASDTEMDSRVANVEDFLKKHFGGFVTKNFGSSYVDQEGNLIMRKTIQVTAYPSDMEFNLKKRDLINQISLWTTYWGQDFTLLEYEDYTFYIMRMEDMLKQGGEVWIQDAVKQMKKKGTIGAFTKQAKREGLTPIAFAKKVLKNPKGYALKTRRRANFVKNVNPDKF
jgi:hypothetical protein